MPIMLFEPNHRGHHSTYVRHLVEYWCEHEWNDELYVVVTPRFVERHQNIVNLSATRRRTDVHFITLRGEEVAALKQAAASRLRPTVEDFLRGKIDPNSHAGLEWKLIGHYATSLAATHCLILFLDSCVLPVAAGLPAPCSFSGIYHFLPYLDARILSSVPQHAQEATRVKQKWMLARTLAHPQLRALFYLDSCAIEQFKLSNPKLVHLPTPVRRHAVSESEARALRTRLAIESNRQVLLMFGDLAERKGLFQMLEAVALLPDELSGKICLMFVGAIRAALHARLTERISALRDARRIQIIERFEFVPDEEVQSYFEIADVVLAPYQHHMGTSGILTLAAAAQKPVLSTNYGYMGRAVQEYGLGLAVDATAPTEIARGLVRLLGGEKKNLCDDEGMWRFAEQNSVDNFTRLIFERVMQ